MLHRPLAFLSRFTKVGREPGNSKISILVFQPASTALALLCLWHGCVEKCGDHRGQPLVAIRKRHMRCAWEHGKLGTRQADEIAYYAAAEQAKHLYNVLGAHDIGVPDDEQGGCFDRGNGLARPAEGRAVEIRYFRDEPMPMLRV